MPAEIISGKELSKELKAELKLEFEKISQSLKRAPRLTAIQIGENSGIDVYTRAQERNSKELGIEYLRLKLVENISEQEALRKIEELNSDPEIDGLILLQPIPEHISAQRLILEFNSSKDVEGIHPYNLGRILISSPTVIPCTPAAVMYILDRIISDYTGKEIVIVGHSSIVGKPLAMLLLDRLATVRVCHIGTSMTGNLRHHVQEAEILIVAVGKAELIKGEWIREGAIVIDVGINRVEDKIVGDVEFEKARERASYITPVPGGVGPLTTVFLFKNLLSLIKNKI
ncbi:MAG TPA: bifunctional 5,10-methylenetetrahydrofolate dehydrogenase/5,10-methenyltetrahydrofolate cyclohydrolase [Candidatus Omnitrophica bacterium]|nr:bifunctional 5,10-methylenetetrahydrofolate dehydrogenase/5,10-methenyltetrahydrofolate cyclohydrolase [Candidatus Omnitrophota bacterium]